MKNKEMIDNINDLLSKFEEIKKKGYIKSNRTGVTGIGKTFEDLLEKKEDQEYNPDYKGIEIKTKLFYSESYTTLFNLTPKGKYEFEIHRILKNYGYKDRILKDCNVLNNSIYANFKNLIGNKYYFKLSVDKIAKKIYLLVYDKNNKLIDNYSYWTFEELKERLYHKLYYLALIKAFKTTRNNQTYYKYTEIKFYKLQGFDKFIELIELGVIRVSFHVGVFRSGPRFKEIHDRGTSFQIKEADILKLYNYIEL